MAIIQIFRLPPNVGLMDRCRGVRKILHGLSLCNAGPRQAGRDGYSETVKTGVGISIFDSNSLQKIMPFARWVFGALIGFGLFIGYKGFKQWNQFRVKYFRHALAAFLVEKNHPSAFSFDILFPNLFHRVQVGFLQSNAVPSGDQEAVLKKCFERFIHVADGFFNFIKLIVRIFRPQLSRIFFQVKFPARVGDRHASVNGLLHNLAEYLQFKNCRISSGAIFAVAVIWFLSPANIVEAMLPGELPRAGDFLFVQKHYDGSPCGKVSFKACGIFSEVLVQKFDYPVFPFFGRIAGGEFSFCQGLLGLHLPGLASIGSDADLTSGALTLNYPCLWIPEFDPPKGAPGLFKKACHLMCPSVPKLPKTVKNNRTVVSNREHFQAQNRNEGSIPFTRSIGFIGFSSLVCPECAFSLRLPPFPDDCETTNSAGCLTPSMSEYCTARAGVCRNVVGNSFL